jgi:hypothetical protein
MEKGVRYSDGTESGSERHDGKGDAGVEFSMPQAGVDKHNILRGSTILPCTI